MQAIILAAGMGKRLGTLTKDNTKCMVQVNGITLIDRLMTQLSAIELSRIIIVVGYKGDELRHHLAKNYQGCVPLEYVENPVFNHTNNIYSLYLARRKMEEDDTLLIESDLIFEDGLLRLAVDAPQPNVALVAKYESWMDGTMVRLDDEDNITGFVPKEDFRYEETHTYYKTVNIYKFSRSFSRDRYLPFLEAYCKVLGNNEYYEQVLRVITFLGGNELKALSIGGYKWYEIDDIQDLDIAECIFSEGDEKLTHYTGRFGGYWRFPYLKDFCYLVNPYFPPQRLKDELRAFFDTLLTEYPSGMRVCSLLAAKCFGINPNHIVPADGAAELIRIVMEHEPGRVGMIWPTFEEYPNRLPKERQEVFVPTRSGFRYTVDDLTTYFADHPVNSLVVINPDNPSGNYLSHDEVLRLADWCDAHEIRLFIDESFTDFSYEGDKGTLIDENILATHPSLIVIKSISKSFGVPGLRLGLLATYDEGYVQLLKRAQPIWGINSFAEFYLQIYGKYETDYKRSHSRFLEARRNLHAGLSEIPFLRVWPSEANFFLVEVFHPYNSTTLTKSLLAEHDILIKDCSEKKAFGGRSFVRIAVRNEFDNKFLIETLKKM